TRMLGRRPASLAARAPLLASAAVASAALPKSRRVSWCPRSAIGVSRACDSGTLAGTRGGRQAPPGYVPCAFLQGRRASQSRCDVAVPADGGQVPDIELVAVAGLPDHDRVARRVDRDVRE